MNGSHGLGTLTLLLLASCTSTPPTDGAAQRYGPVKGESEINAAASVSRLTFSDSDRESTTLTTTLGLGYHVTDSFEVGGQALVAFTDTDDGTSSSDSTVAGLLPYVRYNVKPNERTTLYLGAHAGVVVFDADDVSESNFSYGGHAGWKSWFNPTVAFFVEPRFTRYSIGDSDATELTALFGFSVMF